MAQARAVPSKTGLTTAHFVLYLYGYEVTYCKLPMLHLQSERVERAGMIDAHGHELV